MGLFSPKKKDCGLRERVEALEAVVAKLEKDHETLKRNKDGYKGAMRQVEAFSDRCRKAGCAFWTNVIVSQGQQED